MGTPAPHGDAHHTRPSGDKFGERMLTRR